MQPSMDEAAAGESLRRERQTRKLPSGTILTLLLTAIIIAGGLVAIWPRFTGAGRLRALAREVGARLHVKYPDAKTFVRARPCNRGHVADLTINLDRSSTDIPLQGEEETLRAWVEKQFPGTFVQTGFIAVRRRSKGWDLSHRQNSGTADER